jgi:hypothetical protein
MKHKLFHVLVVGGAALLGGQTLLLADSVEDFDDLAAEKSPIFCSNDAACPKDATGKRSVKDGFECCWGTSCETVDAK